MPYGGDPANDPVDAVRFWAQDTGDPPLISDAEIQYLLDTYTPANGGDPIYVAAVLCDQIAARYADEIDITADGVSYSGSELQQKYNTVAKTLRESYNELRGLGGEPYVGGVKIGDCPAWGTRRSQFTIGQFDNARAGSQFGSYADDGLVGAEYGEPW